MRKTAQTPRLRAAGARGMSWLAGRRRALAGACAAGAVALLVLSMGEGGEGSGGPEVTVVAAARDLPAGRPLSGRDLIRVRLPRGAVPAGALTRADGAVGRAPATVVRRGETLTDVRLRGGGRGGGPAGGRGGGRDVGSGGGTAPGLVAVPVRMADAAAVGLLRAGERVDVLAVDAEPPAEVRTVAAGLEVIAVPRADLAGEGALVMLAATPAQARELARESAVARLSFTIPGR